MGPCEKIVGQIWGVLIYEERFGGHLWLSCSPSLAIATPTPIPLREILATSLMLTTCISKLQQGHQHQY